MVPAEINVKAQMKPQQRIEPPGRENKLLESKFETFYIKPCLEILYCRDVHLNANSCSINRVCKSFLVKLLEKVYSHSIANSLQVETID